MNNDDKKIKDLLTAYAQAPASEAFVQQVMRRVRHEQTEPRPAWRLWFPRLAVAGMAMAALLFALTPHQPVQRAVAPQETGFSYEVSLLDASSTENEEPETEALIETYFL